MELLDYIRKNYKTPNVAVLRTLGASEELIEYLTNTPWNTNIKVVESLTDNKSDDEGGGKFPGEIICQSIITSYQKAYDDDDDYGYGQATTDFNEQVYNIEVGDKLNIYIENELWYELTITKTDSDSSKDIFAGNGVSIISVPKDKNSIWFKSNTTTYNPPSAKVGATITVVKVK